MTDYKNLILIGGGTSCIETIDLINEINRFNKKKIKIIGILDDNHKIKNKSINGYKVLGKISLYKKYLDCNFFLNILSYKNRFKRAKLIKKLNNIKKKFINLIHPSSLIGGKVYLGCGNIIYNNCNIFSNVRISHFNVIYPNVSIASGCRLNINNFLAKNVSIGCGSNLSDNCSIQINSIILEKIKIASGVRSLPNTLISKSFKEKNILIGGYPAKIIIKDK